MIELHDLNLFACTISTIALTLIYTHIHSHTHVYIYRNMHTTHVLPIYIHVINSPTASFLSCLVPNRPKRPLRMLLHPLRARILLHRRRPLAAPSKLHSQATAQHRPTSRPMAPHPQRSVLQKDVLPQDQGQRGAGRGRQGVCGEE